ncbi:MAG: hypothetical protein JXR96_02685 [Deltaproteobacteria bacterium]|nr:hypothetical protein [Deltaproteobacteria bacterium]
MRGRCPIFALGLCALAACDAPPLPEPLDPAAEGQRAVELFLPAYRAEALDVELLAELEGADADRLRLELDAISGSLGEPLSFECEPASASIALEALSAWAHSGGVSAQVHFESSELLLPLEVFSEGEPLRTCFATAAIALPSATVAMELTEQEGSLGLAATVHWDAPRQPAEVVLEEGCPEQPGSQLASLVRQAVDEALRVGLAGLAGDVALAVERSTGLTAGVSIGLGEPEIRFSLLAALDSIETDSAVRVGLAGGFEADRASCVPDLPLPPPASGAAASIAELLPRSGEGYGMAVAFSRAFLLQGLAGVHRAGLVCRHSGQGGLSIEIADLFPSLGALGQLGEVRVAIWPDGQPELDFAGADVLAGEVLPRVLVHLPEVRMDLYIDLEGANVRVLGARADVGLNLAPRLEDDRLSFALKECQVLHLQIDHAELLAESGETLRSKAGQAIGRVAAAQIEALEPLTIYRPACAGGEVLESRLLDEHVVLYFDGLDPPGLSPIAPGNSGH